MSIASDVSDKDRSDQRRQKLFATINRAAAWLNALGLGWLTPLLKIAAGDDPREQLGELRDSLVFPLMGIGMFLVAWAVLAPQVQTSLGAIPGPAQVWEQAGALWQDHVSEREKETEFYARQDERMPNWLPMAARMMSNSATLPASQPSSTRSSHPSRQSVSAS